MKIHRFFVGEQIELKHDFWVHEQRLIDQWRKVLRMRPGEQLVLFDGVRNDRLYRLEELTDKEAHLVYVTDYERRLPKREVYLLWALLKKDKNDWVLQKATELGVRHLIPLMAERSEKTGFDVERARRIIVEAAEQCGRSDIPAIREPLMPETAIQELSGSVRLLVSEESSGEAIKMDDTKPAGVLVGPEGGWSDAEKKLFTEANLPHFGLGDLTLRAETAAVVASGKLMQL